MVTITFKITLNLSLVISSGRVRLIFSKSIKNLDYFSLKDPFAGYSEND